MNWLSSQGHLNTTSKNFLFLCLSLNHLFIRLPIVYELLFHCSLQRISFWNCPILFFSLYFIIFCFYCCSVPSTFPEFIVFLLSSWVSSLDSLYSTCFNIYIYGYEFSSECLFDYIPQGVLILIFLKCIISILIFMYLLMDVLIISSFGL